VEMWDEARRADCNLLLANAKSGSFARIQARLYQDPTARNRTGRSNLNLGLGLELV
jgi:hypothetical protein